jgi:hypothetical protein
MVMFIHKEDYYKKGESGIVRLSFDRKIQKFNEPQEISFF